MKIAHVNMFFLPAFGGVEQVMYELASRQVKQGHEVHVFCCDSDKNKIIDKKEEIIEGIHIHRLPVWFRLSLNTFIWPSLFWKFKGDFDIVHSLLWNVLSTLLVVAIWFLSAWLFRVKEFPGYSDLRFVYKSINPQKRKRR